MICYPKVKSKILKSELPKDLRDKVRIEKDKRISLSKRKGIDAGDE